MPSKQPAKFLLSCSHGRDSDVKFRPPAQSAQLDALRLNDSQECGQEMNSDNLWDLGS